MRIYDNSLTPVEVKTPDFKVSTDYYQVEHGYERDGLPTAEDGLRSIAAVYAAVASAKKNGLWVDARPPIFGSKSKSLFLE